MSLKSIPHPQTERARLVWRAVFSHWRQTRRGPYIVQHGNEDARQALGNMWRFTGRAFVPVNERSWSTMYRPSYRLACALRRWNAAERAEVRHV